MKQIDDLYSELDHLSQAEFIIAETIKACANAIADAAANENDRQMQRRTALSEIAHRLRMAIHR
jgi:hypothetical protein